MSKKKQQLILEVLTNKDWDEHIKYKDGLVVAEIYTDAFGPSVAMQSRTKQFKVEQPLGQLITLAAVCADTVELVSRLKGHSEPTFMFLVNNQMINMYIGCNGPQLSHLLNEEFARELDVRKGLRRHKFLPFDKPTEAELERNKRLDEALYAEVRAEEERRAAALLAIRERAYEQISQALKATTVVIFLTPSVEGGNPPEIAEVLKETWGKMGIDVVRENSLIINEEMANEIFYQRKLPQHKLLVEILLSGYSVVMLLKKERPGEGEEDKGGQGDAKPPEEEEEEEEQVGDTYPIEIGEIEKMVAESVYGFYPDDDGNYENDQVGEKDLEEGTTPNAPEEEEDDWEEEEDEDWDEENQPGPTGNIGNVYGLQPREMRPPPESPAGLLIRRHTVENVPIPGIYAPFTPYSKAAAVRVLFSSVAQPHYEMEELPPEPPPSLLMIFDASKRYEVMEIASEYAKDIINMGLFNDHKRRIADTVEDYDSLRRGLARDTIVLSIAKKSINALLALSALGPTYISPTSSIGKDDDRLYFDPQNVVETEETTLPEQHAATVVEGPEEGIREDETGGADEAEEETPDNPPE